MLYGARREGMCTTSSHASVCAYRMFVRTGTIATVPAAGPTTLGAHAFVEMIMSAASKQLHDRHRGCQYREHIMSEWHELARGGLGAGWQRTIATGHAEVAGTILVAELAHEAAGADARLLGAATSARVARQQINKPVAKRAWSGSAVCPLSPQEAWAPSAWQIWYHVHGCVI